MKTRNIKFYIISICAFVLIYNASIADELGEDRGKKINAMCQGCHGIAGFRTAYPEVYSVPMLGGQSKLYLVNALKAYRNGDRKHPGMRAIASALSDEDISDLADFYSSSKTIIEDK